MNAIINIITTTKVITVTDIITFDPTEMPYVATGYKNNASSQSSAEDLDAYWNLVDRIFAENNISKDDYITLKNITADGKFWGIED